MQSDAARPNFQPNFGLAVNVSRSSFAFNNSSMGIIKYDSGTQTVLESKNLPFQLEFGTIYTVTITIAQDLSVALQVSDGVNTDNLSTGSSSFTIPINFDQFFISSVQGGVSFNTTTLGDFIYRFDDVLFTQAVRTVLIDIKPDSDPNCFSLNGHGVIPVAILGSTDFDVSQINTSTLLFNGLAVRVRGNTVPQCSIEYSNNDEFLDLVCHFEDDPSQWVTGTDDNATLTGELLDGTPIEGTDSVCIVP